jgi:hypothetical protein
MSVKYTAVSQSATGGDTIAVETKRVARLALSLRFLMSVNLTILVTVVALNTFLHFEFLKEDTRMAHMILWSPFNDAYQMMMVGIYAPWAAFAWKAAAKPQDHHMFIDLTIWSFFGHAGVMLVAALLMGGLEYWHLLGDVPMMILLAGLLLLFRPAKETCAP